MGYWLLATLRAESVLGVLQSLSSLILHPNKQLWSKNFARYPGQNKKLMEVPLFGFQNSLSMMYDRLPVGVRSSIDPVLKPVSFTLKRVLSNASQIYPSVYRLQGKGRWGDGTLTTLLFGEGRGVLPYILNLLYAAEPTKEKLGKIFIGKVKSQTKLYSPGVDLVLVGIDEIFSKFLSGLGFLVIPEWVMFKLDLAKPLPKGKRHKQLNSNLRKVKKYGYSLEMTKDFSKFEYFYHHMYLPYAKNKYGKLSLVGGFHDLRKIFERGALLLTNRGNECIVGDLIQMDKGTISSRYTGVRDGKIEYVEEGALAASYYFTILWAKEKGYKWVDFGHCRPFFHDGAFLHKKAWGMEIMKSTRRTLSAKAIVGMKACSRRPELLNFLAKNPFITIDRGKLKGLIFTQQEPTITPEEVQALHRTYSIPGIDSFVIGSPETNENVSSWR